MKKSKGGKTKANLTVAQAIELYLERHDRKGKNGKKISTKRWKSREQGHSKLIAYFAKRKTKVKDFSSRDLRKCIDSLHKDTYGPGTLPNIVSRIRRSIDFCVENNLCPPPRIKSKSWKLKLPKPVDKQMHYSLCELRQFYDYLSKLPDDDNWMFIAFLFQVSTGIRFNTLVELTWKQVDCEKSSVEFRHTGFVGDRRNSFKKHPIPDELCWRLFALKKRRGAKDTDRVFLYQNGGSIKSSNGQKVWNNLHKVAGVTKVKKRATLGLRHSCKKYLGDVGGVPDRLCSGWLDCRHDGGNGISRGYVNLSDADLQECLVGVEKLWEGIKTASPEKQ